MQIFTPNTVIKSADVNLNFDELNSGFGKCVNVQNVTTNVVVTDQYIQRGWGYTTHASNAQASVTITLPVAYDDAAYDLSVSMLGYHADNPTARTEATSLATNEFTPQAVILTSQTFTVSTTFAAPASTERICFSWITIGTKTR